MEEDFIVFICEISYIMIATQQYAQLCIVGGGQLNKGSHLVNFYNLLSKTPYTATQ